MKVALTPYNNNYNMNKPPNYLYVKYINKEKGYGVFTERFIKAGDIIETCYCIRSRNSIAADDFKIQDFADYIFNYPKGNIIQGSEYVLPTGFGCIYNHSDENNARWENSKEAYHFDFISERDIFPNEEICTYYGQHYWPDKKERNK